MTTRRTLGQVIKQHRKAKNITRLELTRRMEERDFDLPNSTIETWELPLGHKRAAKNQIIWNPDFLGALAEALETDELTLLNDMGFPVIPEGFTAEDVRLAKRIRSLSSANRRKETIKAILDLLDTLGVE